MAVWNGTSHKILLTINFINSSRNLHPFYSTNQARFLLPTLAEFFTNLAPEAVGLEDLDEVDEVSGPRVLLFLAVIVGVVVVEKQKLKKLNLAKERRKQMSQLC